MSSRMRWLLGAALAIGIVAAGVGVGIARSDAGGSGDAAESEGADQDQPLTGSDRDRAVQAALDAVGGGTVTEVEEGDDGAAYTVEIRKADGSQVEVQLDAAFTVSGTESDDD
jgi:uncharacterized membrane protein YkoI